MRKTYAWLAVIMILMVAAYALWGEDVAFVSDFGPAPADRPDFSLPGLEG